VSRCNAASVKIRLRMQRETCQAIDAGRYTQLEKAQIYFIKDKL